LGPVREGSILGSNRHANHSDFERGIGSKPTWRIFKQATSVVKAFMPQVLKDGPLEYCEAGHFTSTQIASSGCREARLGSTTARGNERSFVPELNRVRLCPSICPLCEHNFRRSIGATNVAFEEERTLKEKSNWTRRSIITFAWTLRLK